MLHDAGKKLLPSRISGTGARAGSTLVFDGSRHLHRTPTPVIFSIAGAPTAGVASPPFIVDGGARLRRFRVALATSGSSSTVVDLQVNSVTQATVTLAAMSTTGSDAVNVAVADGDLLTVVASTVGAGAAGVTAQVYLA